MIVAVDAKEDLSRILGRHRWGDVLYLAFVKYVQETHNSEHFILPGVISMTDKCQLRLRTEHLTYTSTTSNTMEIQGRGLHSVRQGCLTQTWTRYSLLHPDPRNERPVFDTYAPADFPIKKDNYPRPSWTDIPIDDWRLYSLVLPIPRLHVEYPPSELEVHGDPDEKSIGNRDVKPAPQQLVDALADVGQNPSFGEVTWRKRKITDTVARNDEASIHLSHAGNGQHAPKIRKCSPTSDKCVMGGGRERW